MRKLVLFDADSTLFNEEVIDLLAVKADCSEEISRITSKAMAGEIDFKTSLIARVSLLQGLSEKVLNEVRSEITITRGGKELIGQLLDEGHVPAVVSGGFEEVIVPILAELKVRLYKANRLQTKDGLLTGRVKGEIIDRSAKALWLEDFAKQSGIAMENTIAVGDGANDIEMIKRANLGIAFCAKPALKGVADVSIDERNLMLVKNYLR